MEGEATLIVEDDTVHYRYMGDDALMTKIRDDGCIPSVENEEDPLLDNLLIAMLCVGIVILLLFIVLLCVLFKKKPKPVNILRVYFSVCSRNTLINENLHQGVHYLDSHFHNLNTLLFISFFL